MKWATAIAAVCLFAIAGWSMLHDHASQDRALHRAEVAEAEADAAEVRAAAAEADAAATRAANVALQAQLARVGETPIVVSPVPDPVTPTTSTTVAPVCTLTIFNICL